MGIEVNKVYFQLLREAIKNKNQQTWDIVPIGGGPTNRVGYWKGQNNESFIKFTPLI